MMFNRTEVLQLNFCGLFAGALLALAVGGCSDGYTPSGPDTPQAADSSSASESDSRAEGTSKLPQALPDAETGIPAWVGKDKDEPFDVKRFLESRAAPADNAAPLYFAALAEVSTEMYLPEPLPDWPWEKEKMPKQVRELSDAILEIGYSEKLLSGSVPLSEIEAVLAKAKPALEKLDEAQQKPRCAFINRLRIDSLLPNVMGARTFARLGCIQLYHARLTGNFDEAEQAVRRMLRFSRDLRPRGVMLTQMVAWTIDGIVLSAVADFTLTQSGLDVKDCDRLLALLVEHEREAVPSVEEGIKTDYVMLRNSMDAMQQGRITPQYFAQMMAVEGDQKPADIEKRLDQVNWQAEVTALNAAFAEALTLAAVPYHQTRADSMKERFAPILNAPDVFLASMLVPSVNAISEGAARSQTKLAGTQCLIAVRRYELQHNKLPPDLATATSEAGLKKAPTDPFSGQPMRYKVIDGKPVVYSVGRDRKDDGGEVDWKYGQQPGDYIFRIRE